MNVDLCSGQSASTNQRLPSDVCINIPTDLIHCQVNVHFCGIFQPVTGGDWVGTLTHEQVSSGRAMIDVLTGCPQWRTKFVLANHMLFFSVFKLVEGVSCADCMPVACRSSSAVGRDIFSGTTTSLNSLASRLKFETKVAERIWPPKERN